MKFREYIYEKDLIGSFKKYDPVKDEDELNKQILKKFGFKPESLSTNFNNKFTGIVGDNQLKKQRAVSIIGSGEEYNNPEQIDEKSLRNIADTLLERGTESGIIFTNCGVDLGTKYPSIKKIKVVKVPNSL